MSRPRALFGFLMAVAIAGGCSTEAVFPDLDEGGTPTPPVIEDDHRPAAVRADVGQGTVTVDWELVPGAVGYAVYVSSDGALATDAWKSVAADRVDVQAPPATLDATSGPGHWLRVVAVYATAESFGMSALEYAPIGVGWDGLVPSTDPSARWLRTGAGNQDYGYALAGLGDVNGDGIDDFAVGAPSIFDTVTPFVSVFRGSADGPFTPPETRFGADDSKFGYALAGPGRVDVDTLADLFIGAPTFVVGTNAIGAVFLYRGDAGKSVEATEAWSDEGGQPSTPMRFGASVTGLGDLNGDNRGDVCAGAPDAITPSTGGGLYQCYRSSGATLEASGFINTGGSAPNEHFGHKVAGVGDLDADGKPDFVATGPGGRNGANVAVGEAHVYRGTVTNLLGFTAAIEGTGVNTLFGYGLSKAGDVDADGYDDFVIGSINTGAGSHGTADLYLGRPTTPYYAASSWTPQVVVTNGSATFGGAIASGDVNADGFSDVMVGAPFHHLGVGSLSLFLGGPAGLPDVPSLVIRGAGIVQRLGTAVATADVNGDGSQDVIVSSGEVTSADPGDVLVYYGAPVRGPVLDAGPSRTAQVNVALGVAGITLTPVGVDQRMRCIIDWGDGSALETVSSCTDGALDTLSHTFNAAGEFVVRVRAESLGYGTTAESIFTATVED